MRKVSLAVAAVLAGSLLATTPAGAKSHLFESRDELTLTLNAPIGRLIRQASVNTDAVQASAVVEGGQPIPLKIAPRGFTRRTTGICTFPPLKLDFDEPSMTGTIFESQNKLKLVTQCRPLANYEQMLVREFVVYRLYNEVTPLSFRVRPVRVTYHDTESRRDDYTRFAFLIEDADEMAKRNGLKELKFGARELSSRQIESAALVRFALFQLLIANLDTEYFAGPAGENCCHNSKLVGPDGATNNLIPVPYDFDFSELVRAPYATAPAGLKVSGPYVRTYRGHCRANGEVPAAAAFLLGRRAAMEAVITGEARLNAASKRDMLRVLGEGFALLDDPRTLDRVVSAQCR